MVDLAIRHFNGWWDGDIHDNECIYGYLLPKISPKTKN
jgi:hypothetical protein